MEVVGDVDLGAVDDVVVLADDLSDGIVVDEEVVIAVGAVVDDEEEDEEEEDEEGERSVAHGGDGDLGASVAKTGEMATTPRNPTARPTSERRYMDTPYLGRVRKEPPCAKASLNLRNITRNYNHSVAARGEPPCRTAWPTTERSFGAA